MSRFVPAWIPNANPKLIFNAAKIWRDRCLLNNKSVFTDKELWTKENFTKHLQECYIERLDTGKGGFLNKLEAQLERASPEVKQLAAEIFWMMVLLPFTTKVGNSKSMISYNKKISNIKEIWRWSGEDFPEKNALNEKDLLDCLKQGVASWGRGTFKYYWQGLYYCIIWLQHWKLKPLEKQQNLIKDYKKFAEDLQIWEDEHCEEVQQNAGINIRNAAIRPLILYILFPDYFERPIIREGYKREIIACFRKEKEGPSRSNWDDDKLLLEIRQEEEERRQSKGQDKDFDFYDEDYRKKWDPDRRKSESPGEQAIEKNTDNQPSKTPLNQILYGPPGTGKTYATRRMAVEIIEDPDKLAEALKDKDEQAKQTVIKKLYAQFKKEKKIHFVTFHQSYGYEDFVEGIKPSVVNDKNIIYKREDGIFKEICDKARSFKEDNFEDVIAKLKEECGEEYQNLPGLWTPIKKSPFEIRHTGTGNFRIRTRDGEGSDLSVSVEALKALHRQGKRPTSYQPYVEGIYQYMRNEKKLNEFPKDAKPEGRYVLIIDEINRGNISKILGELITLLEEDKRQGNDEELSVTLPHSPDDEFSVPNNLYIIGTMNTADRSIAFLDTALRRRFRFKEMMPKYNALTRQIKGIDIAKMLKTINERITKHLDRDHQIGHSYFLKLQEEILSNEQRAFKELQYIFEQSIIPLLREYFFGRDDKIKEILGDAFFEKNENDEENERLLEGAELKKALKNPVTYQSIYNKNKTEQ